MGKDRNEFVYILFSLLWSTCWNEESEERKNGKKIDEGTETKKNPKLVIRKVT
jgi:hypothetical protein